MSILGVIKTYQYTAWVLDPRTKRGTVVRSNVFQIWAIKWLTIWSIHHRFASTSKVSVHDDVSNSLQNIQHFNPHPTKWGPMRPHLIINIYHSSHGWTIRFKEFVLMYKPPWMQILLLYYICIWKCGAHFSDGIDPSNENNSSDSDNKNKNKRTKPNKH